MSSSRERIGSRLYKLFLLTLLTLTSFSLEGKEISGAFGLSLGEIYTGKLVVNREMGPNRKLYNFEPQNPHPLFSNYGVFITPKTKRIESILVWKEYKNTRPCFFDFQLIETLLDEKYKNFKKDPLKEGDILYQDGSNFITLGCTNEELMLLYLDWEMQELFQKETAEMQDSDGF